MGGEAPLQPLSRGFGYFCCVPVALGLRWSRRSWVDAVTCIYKWDSGEGKGEEKLALSVNFSGEFLLCRLLCLPLAALG